MLFSLNHSRISLHLEMNNKQSTGPPQDNLFTIHRTIYLQSTMVCILKTDFSKGDFR